MSSIITRFLVSKIMDFLKVAWAPSCHLISCLIKKPAWGAHAFFLLINKIFCLTNVKKKTESNKESIVSFNIVRGTIQGSVIV